MGNTIAFVRQNILKETHREEGLHSMGEGKVGQKPYTQMVITIAPAFHYGCTKKAGWRGHRDRLVKHTIQGLDAKKDCIKQKRNSG